MRNGSSSSSSKNDQSGTRWWTWGTATLGMTAVLALAAWVRADDKPATTSAAAATTNAATKPAGPTGDRELAPRYCALAQDTLRQKPLFPAHLKQAVALLRGAAALDPAEPRYARMLYEALLQQGDADGALEAVKAYRGINQQTANDQVAMVTFIDLTAGTMETAEERAEYLEKLLAVTAPDKERNYEGAAAAVRSHVAMRASQLARERGQSDLEDAMLRQALELNPLNIDALRRRLEVVAAGDGSAADRMGVMLDMVRSNPVQPALLFELAKETAGAGVHDEALRFYKFAALVAGGTGTSLGREFAFGYAAELYLSDVPQALNDVRQVAAALLKNDANDVEGQLLRWLSARAAKDKDEAVKAAGELVNAALNRLTVLRGQLGAKEATTRPVDSTDAVTIPDLSGDLKALEADKNAAVRVPYAHAVADLAWYLVYADNRPVEAVQLVPTLKALLGESSVLPARIEGWAALAPGGNADMARMKLQAAAGQDDLAHVGLLMLRAKDPAEKDKVAAEAKELLTRNPSGLVAVVLTDLLRGTGAKADERADAAELRARINAFPWEFMRVLDAPNSFYTLRGEMVDRRIVFPYAEPMTAAVTIRNTSKFPLTVGAEGVIRNELCFDAQFRGLVQQAVPWAAVDRLGRVLVLMPGEAVTQTFRVDQGQLNDLAKVLANPLPTLTFFAWVRTNPRLEGGSGLCGQAVQFAAISERSGFALNQQGVQVLNDIMDKGAPADKLRALDLVVALVAQLRAQQQNAAKFKPVADALVEQLLERKTNDLAHGVATWAMFTTAYNAPQRSAEMMNRMLADVDPTRRLLGVMVAGSLPPESQRELLKKIAAEDKSPFVKEYAGASLEVGEERARAKQAATPAPSAAPATSGTGTSATTGQP